MHTLYTLSALPQSPANCRHGINFLFTEGHAMLLLSVQREYLSALQCTSSEAKWFKIMSAAWYESSIYAAGVIARMLR